MGRPAKPTHELIAPKGLTAKPSEIAPTFSMPAARLRVAFDGVTSDPTNVREGSRDGEPSCYVEKTGIFHFKDDICVQSGPLGANFSTINPAAGDQGTLNSKLFGSREPGSQLSVVAGGT